MKTKFLAYIALIPIVLLSSGIAIATEPNCNIPNTYYCPGSVYEANYDACADGDLINVTIPVSPPPYDTGQYDQQCCVSGQHRICHMFQQQCKYTEAFACGDSISHDTIYGNQVLQCSGCVNDPNPTVGCSG
jgi:hypothetical protein